MSGLSLGLGSPTAERRAPPLPTIPILAGGLAALAMLALYVGILTLLQSFDHAVQQAAQDWSWVGLVAVGFGVQIGLYTYLRVIIRSANTIGATAMAGTGTGTSTLGMIACCAHHLTDVAPLLALTGASGLSGVIAFFSDWKYAIIAVGLVVNAIGILITVRTIRRARQHLRAMLESFAIDPDTVPEAVPSCH